MDAEKLRVALQKLTRVFRYLEALNQHRNPAKRQLREQPWGLWMRDLPAIPGGWGKMGHPHIRLAAASEDVLMGALRTAWKLRIDKNAKTSQKTNHLAERSGVTDKKRGKRTTVLATKTRNINIK